MIRWGKGNGEKRKQTKNSKGRRTELTRVSGMCECIDRPRNVPTTKGKEAQMSIKWRKGRGGERYAGGKGSGARVTLLTQNGKSVWSD